MSETTSEINVLKPVAKEDFQSLATSTLDAETSPVAQEAEASTPVNDTAELESRPAVADSNVEVIAISGSKAVITENERVPEQVISPEQTVSTAATPVVAQEQPSATPAEPGQLVPTSAETIQVETVPAVTSQEAAPNLAGSIPLPENIAEPAMSATAVHPNPTTTDPRPVETAEIPAVTTTTEPQPQSQPAGDAKLAAEAPSKSTNEKAEASSEPQNKLTQKFTEAEWKALKEFRVQLPDIFADAYPDQPNARETPITLWGVIFDPANPQSDARVSVILMKFLRARHLGVRDARAMLVNTLRWREEFDVKAAVAEDYPKDIFGTLGYIYGCDKERRPVVYNIYGGNQNLKAVFGDVNRFLRWRVALMEKSVAELDFSEVDQTIQIHDYAGVSLSSRDANSKAAASEASNIFQSHYPEFLYKKLFVNIPTLLAWIYWAFKPLVSAETLAKMSVVGTGKSSIRKALLPYMDIKQIPTRYGGEAQGF